MDKQKLHGSTIAITAFVIGLDGLCTWRLDSSILLLLLLQLPVAAVCLLGCCARRRWSAALSVLLVLAVGILCSSPAPRPVIRARVALAGRAELVREGRELIRQRDLRPEANPHEFQLLRRDPAMPPALASLDPVYVWASSGELEVKKFGLGDFSGYVVTAEDRHVPSGQVAERLAPGLWWVERY